jgi:glycerol-3-phosphate cytidylyltransferase
MRYKTGYTTGVFDLFHIGHLNLLKAAAAQCEKLIVGVCTDELALQLKNKKPIISFDERIEIVRNIACVHEAIAEQTDDKISAWKTLKFDVVFKGDDWKGTPKWKHLEKEFNAHHVDVVFLSYTHSVSTTLIQRMIAEG